GEYGTARDEAGNGSFAGHIFAAQAVRPVISHVCTLLLEGMGDNHENSLYGTERRLASDSVTDRALFPTKKPTKRYRARRAMHDAEVKKTPRHCIQKQFAAFRGHAKHVYAFVR